MTPKTKIFLVTKDKKTIHQIDAIAKNGSPIQVDEIFGDIKEVVSIFLFSFLTSAYCKSISL